MSAAAQPAIDFTFQEEGHIYRDMQSQQILSVTQILDSVGIVDYSAAPEERLRFKSEIGNAVHKATEFIDTPELGDFDWDTLDLRCVPYVVAWEKFKDETGFVPEKVEFKRAVRLPQGIVAFTLDRIGMLGCQPTIVEIKCTLKEEASWRVQLAGYNSCITALGIKPAGTPTFKRVAVQLRPNSTYKLYPYVDSRVDLNVWNWAAALACWKQNNGYKFEK